VHSDRFSRLRERLGLPDVSEELLEQAFRHTSFVREQGMDDLASNQRLEFLGDAVLDVIFADFLYLNHPELSEGQLTRLKAALVRKSALASIAVALNLGEFLLLGHGEESSGGRDKHSLLADVVEALIGAVFLASGWDASRRLVLDHFGELLADAESRETLRDSKSSLQELVQGRGAQPPDYHVVRTEGPPHDRVFRVQALFSDAVIGEGSGASKRDAEQQAAANALAAADEWLTQ